jgi:amino acid adenylation domain-containing protein
MFPTDRTRTMLVCSGCRSLIVDSVCEPQLERLLTDIVEVLSILVPERVDTSRLAARWPRHRFVGATELETGAEPQWETGTDPGNSIAYLLFTSGSTGIPKGVAVSQRNVTRFVDVMVERYGVDQHDRFSQTFDMTFDLSAFDMFAAWEHGACVCCPSHKTMLNPASFIQNSRLTIWFSVPSVGLLMKRLGTLKPNQYPTLRWSLFCGEPLPAEIAIAWAQAAPNSVVENLYGPTELTIACSAYRWNSQTSRNECERNLVPIGDPYPEMEALIVDDNLREVGPGEEGELLMTGPQVSLGYWRDSEKTAASFIVPPGKSQVYYRTGDRVRRPRADGPMVFMGRMDHQIKVQGHRVELGEVEALLRQEAGVEVAAAVGWPLTARGARAVEAFVADSQLDAEGIREKLKAKLPRYAVPRRIHVLDSWPLSANGKVDRNQLLAYLKKEI